jgi:transcriptional regulator with XRE-family HTH domain
MPQTVISRIENGDAASLSIKTLLKLAAAFDVALVVRFEPIDKLVHWVDNLSPEAMSPKRATEVLAEMESETVTIAAAPARSASATGHLRVVAINAAPTQADLGFTRQLREVPSPSGSLATRNTEYSTMAVAVAGGQ